ncbi:ribonuclease HI [Streptomyces sp. SID4919]|uniref:ribonuclease H family protein n=1 Tax=unclassified Streptomyces TaxID=2593676 RepID=UPI000823D850|nr:MULTISPECIES: ribonuclease H [unclassified Streptomyces]MYY12341.1 ribonuclease HI [Streptomyces sp. SID4919]SCK53892.1 ribonuclease HI [Streptomyces sp. AmelKG-E11A]
MIGAMNDRIIAAADGSSKGNPGRAGWAWVAADAQGRPQRWESGPLGTATNNVAELTALERLLEATPPGTPLEVRMDSQYAMKAVTQWLPGWKRNGWRTSGGGPVANRDLVERIDTLLSGRDVELVYVPAHQQDGDPLNAIADQAASDAAGTQEPAGTALGHHDLPVPAPERAGAPPRAKRKAPAQRKRGSGSTGGAPTITAKFAGRCPCGTGYPAGSKITKLDKGWGHPGCLATEQGAGDR